MAGTYHLPLNQFLLKKRSPTHFLIFPRQAFLPKEIFISGALGNSFRKVFSGKRKSVVSVGYWGHPGSIK